MRKSFTAEFKAKVALEAVRGDRPITEIASKYEVHANQVRQWKKEMVLHLPDIFSGKKKRVEKQRDQNEAKLFEQIGRLKVEVDWLKKKSDELTEI